MGPHPLRCLSELFFVFFFSSRRRHTRCSRDWSSDVCSSDLLLVGPVFATPAPPTPPERPPLGPAALGAIARLGLPVVAIGGITPQRVREVKAAGAYGVAAIRALWDAVEPAAAARRMIEELVA